MTIEKTHEETHEKTKKMKNGKNIGIFKIIPNGQGYADEEDSE